MFRALPETIYYTTIPSSHGRLLGFVEDELGEFDHEEDLWFIEETLRGSGVRPVRLGWGGRLVETLLREPPPLLWNLNSGVTGPSRTAQVPALCEMLGIPLVGSGSWTAALVQDKTALIAFVGALEPDIATSPGLLVLSPRDLDPLGVPPFPGPYIIKPNNDESSRGLCAVVDGDRWEVVVESTSKVLAEWGPVRIERYVRGLDVTANAAPDAEGNLVPLEPLILRHGQPVYSGSAKAQMAHERVPLRACAPETADTVKRAVARLCEVLRFRHYARFDFRLEEASGQPFLLEANLCPSFEPEDDFAKSAAASGIGYAELLMRILEAAESDRVTGRSFADLPLRLRSTWSPDALVEFIRSV